MHVIIAYLYGSEGYRENICVPAQKQYMSLPLTDSSSTSQGASVLLFYSFLVHTPSRPLLCDGSVILYLPLPHCTLRVCVIQTTRVLVILLYVWLFVSNFIAGVCVNDCSLNPVSVWQMDCRILLHNSVCLSVCGCVYCYSIRV